MTQQNWRTSIAGLTIDLPIMAVSDSFAIALMMITDMGAAFSAHIGAALAERLKPLQLDIIVGTATLGIPVALEVTRALGLDRYVIIQKSPKFFLKDALTSTVTSITSTGEQTLRLDRRALPLIAGKRVALVDDVIATGASIAGSLSLLRTAGADVIAIGTILTEAHEWRKTLGDDAALVHTLGHIPQFSLNGNAWIPQPETL